MSKWLITFTLLLSLSAKAELSYLYKVEFMRAAPGKLAELIEVTKTQFKYYEKASGQKPFWMRHSQGDHWDLMIMIPWQTYDDYYSENSKKQRLEAEKSTSLSAKKYQQQLQQLVSWREDLYAYGPDIKIVKESFTNNSLYHIEIFRALAGKHEELHKQREMENIYYRNINHVENLIFVRDQGAAWDIFTIGFYKDLQHFADPGTATAEEDNQAAIKAGFEGVNTIAFYLRSLISSHHDTLARAIK